MKMLLWKLIICKQCLIAFKYIKPYELPLIEAKRILI